MGETNFQVSLVDSVSGRVESAGRALPASSFSVTLAPISFRLPLLLALRLPDVASVVTFPATGTWPLIQRTTTNRGIAEKWFSCRRPRLPRLKWSYGIRATKRGRRQKFIRLANHIKAGQEIYEDNRAGQADRAVVAVVKDEGRYTKNSPRYTPLELPSATFVFQNETEARSSQVYQEKPYSSRYLNLFNTRYFVFKCVFPMFSTLYRFVSSSELRQLKIGS